MMKFFKMGQRISNGGVRSVHSFAVLGSPTTKTAVFWGGKSSNATNDTKVFAFDVSSRYLFLTNLKGQREIRFFTVNKTTFNCPSN